MWQYKTTVYARVPEIKDNQGKTHILQTPIARKGAHHTYAFEALTLEMSKVMPINKVAEMLQEWAHNLMKINKYYVEKAREKADYSKVKKVGIDETSKAKWHSYITTAVDLDSWKICSIEEGKGKDAVKDISTDLKNHQCDISKIESIAIDLSPSFISWVKTYFKDSAIVFDRFHIMKMMNEVVNHVRKQEAKKDKSLKGSRFLWLKNYDNLDKKWKERLDLLKKSNKELWTIYQIKANLQYFFDIEDPHEAEVYLKDWCEYGLEHWIPALTDFINSVKKHWYWIVSYIEKRVSNWIVEWANSIIQTIKRRARWFRNIERFKTILYLQLWNFDVNIHDLQKSS